MAPWASKAFGFSMPSPVFAAVGTVPTLPPVDFPPVWLSCGAFPEGLRVELAWVAAGSLVWLWWSLLKGFILGCVVCVRCLRKVFR